jgi:hypothetical protein
VGKHGPKDSDEHLPLALIDPRDGSLRELALAVFESAVSVRLSRLSAALVVAKDREDDGGRDVDDGTVFCYSRPLGERARTLPTRWRFVYMVSHTGGDASIDVASVAREARQPDDAPCR